MQKRPKFTHIVKSLTANPELWQETLCKCWQLGSQASLGFSIGEPEDSAAKALAREGYELIVELEDFAVGTNWLTSIVIVTQHYGPWAVDVTELLLAAKVKGLELDQAFQSNKNKNSSKTLTKFNQ